MNKLRENLNCGLCYESARFPTCLISAVHIYNAVVTVRLQPMRVTSKRNNISGLRFTTWQIFVFCYSHCAIANLDRRCE